MATVSVEKTKGVARVILNRPPLNVVDIPMMEEIERALASLKADSATKVVVLAAQGKAFSAGVDIKDHTPDRVEMMLTHFHAIFHTLWSLEQPILAAVQGSALGGGCELAIACDFIVASENAKFGQPEIKVGTFAPIASLLLPLIIGRKKANELLLTGNSIDAREAERLGLVNMVAAPASFDAAVDEFVARLVTLSGVILRHAKHAIRLGLERDLADIERYYFDELMKSEDTLEGLTAFMEKRPPVWKEK